MNGFPFLPEGDSKKKLRALKRKMQRRQAVVENDIPNHGYDSAQALTGKSLGLEEAIKMIEAELDGSASKTEE